MLSTLLLHALISIVSKLQAGMHIFYNSYNSKVIFACKTYLNNMASTGHPPPLHPVDI